MYRKKNEDNYFFVIVTMVCFLYAVINALIMQVLHTFYSSQFTMIIYHCKLASRYVILFPLKRKNIFTEMLLFFIHRTHPENNALVKHGNNSNSLRFIHMHFRFEYL